MSGLTRDSNGRFVKGSTRRPLAARFWSFVVQHERCWEWTGARTAYGYGILGRGTREDGLIYAHRVSWELHNGSLPDGLCVLHTCDNPPCTNPNHLWLGTKGDNNRDMVAKGRHWTQNR